MFITVQIPLELLQMFIASNMADPAEKLPVSTLLELW